MLAMVHDAGCGSTLTVALPLLCWAPAPAQNKWPFAVLDFASVPHFVSTTPGNSVRFQWLQLVNMPLTNASVIPASATGTGGSAAVGNCTLSLSFLQAPVVAGSSSKSNSSGMAAAGQAPAQIQLSSVLLVVPVAEAQALFSLVGMQIAMGLPNGFGYSVSVPSQESSLKAYHVHWSITACCCIRESAQPSLRGYTWGTHAYPVCLPTRFKVHKACWPFCCLPVCRT